MVKAPSRSCRSLLPRPPPGTRGFGPGLLCVLRRSAPTPAAAQGAAAKPVPRSAQAAPPNTQAHGLPAFRFAIILSARVTRAPERAPLLAASRQQPICLPTLVVYGGADTEVPAAMTRELRDTFDPACVTEVFLPEGKHRVPMLQPVDAARCRAFVGRFAGRAGPDAVRAAM